MAGQLRQLVVCNDRSLIVYRAFFRIACFIACLANCVPAVGSQQVGGCRQPPCVLWKRDLRPYGVPDPAHLGPFFLVSPKISATPAIPALAFTTSGNIGLLFFTGRSSLHPAKREVQVHLLSLDALTGKAIAKEWTSHTLGAANSGIWAVAQGSFLVLTGSRASLYSPRLEVLAKQDLPGAEAKSSPWGVLVSPTGRTIMAQRFINGSAETLMLSPETLQVASSHTEPELVGSMSDRTMASIRFQNDEAVVRLRTEESPWKEIYSEPVCKEPFAGPAYPFLLNDHMVFLASGCNGFVVIDIRGKQAVSDRFPENSRVHSEPVPSAAGSRFAILVYKIAGRDWPSLDTYSHLRPWRLLVYEVSRHKPVGELSGDIHLWSLSPDGSELAVVVKHSIELYSLRGGH